MGGVLQEAAVEGPILAKQNLGHHGLQVVVDSPPATTAKELEGLDMRVQHHLQRLPVIRHAEEHPAVTQSEVRHLHLHDDAVQLNDLVAPVELVRFTRIEPQGYVCRTLLDPGPVDAISLRNDAR